MPKPKIDKIGVVLNHRKTKTNNKSHTSRFYIKGNHFDNATTVSISADWGCDVTPHDAKLIFVRARYIGRDEGFDTRQTAMLNVTVTNSDGSTTTPLEVGPVDQGDLP
jgi:hypothetical protein